MEFYKIFLSLSLVALSTITEARDASPDLLPAQGRSQLRRHRERWSLAQLSFMAVRRSSLVLNVTAVTDAFLSDFYGLAEGVVPAGFIDCETTINNRWVRYLQVWKDNTQGICANLLRLGDGSTPQTDVTPYTFTFVREPLSHYVSGFSEKASRAAARRDATSMPCAMAFHPGMTPQAQASAFLEDTLFGRIYSCRPRQPDDLHVFPQATFVSQAMQQRKAHHGAQIDFIGRLEHFDEGWQELTTRITGVPHEYHPNTFLKTVRTGPGQTLTKSWHETLGTTAHRGSDKDSGFLPRAAMAETAYEYELALCLILLPDFACFSFPLPPTCDLGLRLARLGQWRDGIECGFSTTKAGSNLAAGGTAATVPPLDHGSIVDTLGTPQLSDFEAFLRGCTVHEEVALQIGRNTSLSAVGHIISSEWLNLTQTTSRLIAFALDARITGCFFRINFADLSLARPDYVDHLYRPVAGGTGAFERNDTGIRSRLRSSCPLYDANTQACTNHLGSSIRKYDPQPAQTTALLLRSFWTAMPDFPGLTQLYRVEDMIDGWALMFSEALQICKPDDGPYSPYDVHNCQAELLRVGQNLSYIIPVSTSSAVGIFGWGAPATHAYLRWRFIPAAEHDFIVGVKPTKPSMVDWAWRHHQNKGRMLVGDWPGWESTEVILMPGFSFTVSSVEHSTATNYTTVVARQML